jgi:FixJ family two-component response regulator
MASTRSTIGVVEDDAGVRAALQQLLRAAGFSALVFASAEEFLGSNSRRQVDCLIADINLPGMSGVALLQALSASGERLPAVLITGRDDTATVDLMRQAGNVPRLHKPFSDDELFGAIRAVLPA